MKTPVLQAKDAAVVDAKTLPHRVAVLHARVERRDARPVPRDEPAVDVHEDRGIGGIGTLEHARSSS